MDDGAVHSKSPESEYLMRHRRRQMISGVLIFLRGDHSQFKIFGFVRNDLIPMILIFYTVVEKLQLPRNGFLFQQNVIRFYYTAQIHYHLYEVFQNRWIGRVYVY